MKKAKVVVIIFLVAMAFAYASCNKKICPAYAKADTEQAERG